jgi:multiple sugar transport system substrate-binding protein
VERLAAMARDEFGTRDGSTPAWALAPFTRRDVVKSMLITGGAVVFAGYGRVDRAAAQDKIRFSQWYHQYGEEGTQQAAQRYAEEYTKEFPNVEVEMVWVPGDYSGQALPAALLTDSGPDVYEDHPSFAMVKAGQCEPLDDLLTEEIKADFHPNNLAVNTIEGKLYGIKMIDDMGLLYYKKSALEEAGVNPPQTMDEVIAAAKALDTGRVKGLFVGNDGGITGLNTILPWSAGVDFLDPETSEITFNNERTVLAYQKLKELNDSGALLVGAPTDWWDPSALIQGLAAMQWGGLWAMPAITEALGEDFGVVPWPALDAEGTPTTFWGGWSECVNPRGENQQIEEAKKFVKWLWIDRTDLQQDWALSYGFHVPPKISAAETAEPLKTGPASEAVNILSQYGKFLPPQWTAAMFTSLNTHITNIVKNGADAATEVAAAAQECQAELEKTLE